MFVYIYLHMRTHCVEEKVKAEVRKGMMRNK